MALEIDPARFRKPPQIPILPAGWRDRKAFTNKHRNYSNGYLYVITGLELHGDKWWLHVSCSRQDRMPNHDDLCAIKEIFVGHERKAIQVFPPDSEKVNICEFALHLYACADGDGLPDFRFKVGEDYLI